MSPRARDLVSPAAVGALLIATSLLPACGGGSGRELRGAPGDHHRAALGAHCPTRGPAGEGGGYSCRSHDRHCGQHFRPESSQHARRGQCRAKHGHFPDQCRDDPADPVQRRRRYDSHDHGTNAATRRPERVATQQRQCRAAGSAAGSRSAGQPDNRQFALGAAQHQHGVADIHRHRPDILWRRDRRP